MSEKSVYESIIQGLTEALEDSVSKKPILKRQKVVVEPIKKYSAEEVKQIRRTTGMSQRFFAGYLGVSDKTVEAWESGVNHPSGAACRILRMMEMDKDLVRKYPFVTNVMA